MKKLLLLTGFLALIFGGCVKSEDDPFTYRLVVEGWIEEGNVPYVILTQSRPLFSIVDSASIDNMVIRWAKVSVSDGETTEILSGKIDKDYFPPFIYRGARMQGEAGKTYTLKIEYSGKVWTARTTIPRSIPLKEIATTPVAGNDTLFNLEAVFDDPADEKNYYKFFTRIENKSKRYLPALIGNLDDNLFNGETVRTSVYRGLEQSQVKKFNTNFCRKDTVLVKFCTQTEFAFHYWTAYENELVNSQNPLFPANQNLPTNIREGWGIWCGYGQKVYRVYYK